MNKEAAIAAVKVLPLKLLPNDRGQLLEVQRVDDDVYPGFGQLYATTTFSGVVKAWYRHRIQTDQIAIVRGAIRLVLYDDRDGSSTRGVLLELVLEEHEPKLVQIPPGVWHGFQATGPREAVLLHLNSRPYDFETPDEDRLSPDDPSVPFRW